MPRKLSKKAEAEQVRAAIAATEIHLDPLEKQTLLLLDATIRNAQLSRRLLAIEWEKIAAQHQAALKDNVKAEADAKTEIAVVVAAVEAKYGIKMADYAYDDRTGKLNYVGQGPARD